MKTLQSILNSPERRLSAEEMRNLKGGAQYCTCDFHLYGGETINHALIGHVGTGDCGDAGVALTEVYSDWVAFVTCNSY
ncbi:MAG: hypothetical protein PHT92_08650 [Bacteroidales bacterium]|jgi:natural product precursor|nr:hypothetical protein [Bacteroidales bacterium]